MLVKHESAEFVEFCPSEHEVIPTQHDEVADRRRPGAATLKVAANGNNEEEEEESVPIQLQIKFKRLHGETKWWALVPNPFLCLMAFCVGFALLSLAAIAVVATLQSGGETRDDGSGSDDSDSETAATPAGILLCIGVLSSVVGSLQTAAGYCAQRLGHQIDALTRRSKRHQHATSTSTRSHQPRHPLFYIGLLLLVCGTIAAIVNLGILGQSVTAPFAAMTLIFNGCLAFTVLHEAVTNYDVIATVLVLFGVGVAMLGVGLAHLDAQVFQLADIEEIFVRSAFPTIYSIAMLGSLLGFYVVVQKHRLQNKAAGLCCFSIGAGVLSGFSSLCVKCTVEVLKSVVQQEQSSDLSNPILYVFVVGIPVCVLSQLKLMTLGLEHFGTLKFVPPYHAFIILSNLINGMVYFDEASGYDALSAGLFLVGCALTVAGVFVLLAKVPQASDDSEPSAADDTEKKAIDRSSDATESASSSENDPEAPAVAEVDAAAQV